MDRFEHSTYSQVEECEMPATPERLQVLTDVVAHHLFSAVESDPNKRKRLCNMAHFLITFTSLEIDPFKVPDNQEALVLRDLMFLSEILGLYRQELQRSDFNVLASMTLEKVVGLIRLLTEAEAGNSSASRH